MAISSLVIALSVAFLPFWIDQVRARRRAAPIAIIATSGIDDRFAFRASSRLTPAPAESIAVTVQLSNTGTDSTRASAGEQCAVRFQLHSAGDSVGRPRWSGRVGACRASGGVAVLAPGQTELLRTAVAVRDVLGDSLPGGRYLVSAVLTIDGDSMTSAAGTLEIRR